MPSQLSREYPHACCEVAVTDLSVGRSMMAKSQDIKKDSNKKPPQRTLKEKRAAKKAKQAERAGKI